MPGPLIPLLIGSAVSMATNVAVDSAVKLITPSGLNAIKGFLIKGGTFLLAAAVAAKAESFVSKQVEEISEIVKNTPDPVQDITSLPVENVTEIKKTPKTPKKAD